MLIWLLVFVFLNVLWAILLIIGCRLMLAISHFRPSCMEILPIGSVSSNIPLPPSTLIIPKDSVWLLPLAQQVYLPSIPQASALKNSLPLLTSLVTPSPRYASQPVPPIPQFFLQTQSPASAYRCTPQPQPTSPKTTPKNAS